MKGFWAFILSIPVFIITIFTRNVQVLVTYTGGICGTLILFVIPVTLTIFARKRNLEENFGPNFNRSPFKHIIFVILVLIYAAMTFAAVFYGMIVPHKGGGEGGDPCEHIKT